MKAATKKRAVKKKPVVAKSAKATAYVPCKLNLGAGGAPMDGYMNLDRKTGQEVYPLNVADESADEIRASHVLEHFSHREVENVVNHWVSKLKPGGLLKIAVPDFRKIAHAYLTKQPLWTDGYLMGGHVDSDDKHGATFDHESLCRIFHACGLERVKVWASDHPDCSSLPISLNLQGYKPSAPRMPFHGVKAVLASARYGPAFHHQCIYGAFQELGINMHMVQGCFWQQHLSEAIEHEIAQPDTRYILTLDFDTIFEAAHVIELYRIMETHPHVDALVSVQSGRGSNSALFTMADSAGKLMGEVHAGIFDQLTAPINTGHFGLTMLRAEKLRTLPRPWMQPKPNADGRWGEGREDADIAFWTGWRNAGFSIHLANKVAVGHIEDLIMWPAKDFSPIYQRTGDYIHFGKPAEAL